MVKRDNDNNTISVKNWELIIYSEEFQRLVEKYRAQRGISVKENINSLVIGDTKDQNKLSEVVKIFNKFCKNRNTALFIYVYLFTDIIWPEFKLLNGEIEDGKLLIKERKHLSYPEIKSVNKKRGYIDIRLYTNTSRDDLNDLYRTEIKIVQQKMLNNDTKHKRKRSELNNQLKIINKPTKYSAKAYLQDNLDEFQIPENKIDKDVLGNIERGARRLKKELSDNKK